MREDFRSIRRLRYPIPDVIDPAESLCITVRVPNDIRHIAAFWGQLFALSKWYAWAEDAAHSGKQLAEVWRTVYEAAQEENCMSYIVRQHPANSCELQRSFDGGTVWETWADLYSCGVRAAQDTFGTGSDNGASHTQPGEQPGGDNPDPDQCFDLDLTINANGMTLIPLPVVSGWTMCFTEVKGAWNDGTLTHDWVCPTGHAFFFGVCSALVESTVPEDPLNTEPHMKLIMRLPDGSYVAPPLDGSEYIVPEGMPEGNTFLLANDTPLSDNQGSVSLHLLACNTSLHCYEWDFSASDCGFVPGGYNHFGADGDGRIMGAYGAGQWGTTDNYSPSFNWSDRAVSISREFTALTVRKLQLVYDYTSGTGNWGARFFVDNADPLVTSSINGTDLILEWTGVLEMNKLGAQVWPSGHSGNYFDGYGAIKKIRIYSTDPAPEGAVECA